MKNKDIHLERTNKRFISNVMGVTLPFILSLFPIILLKKYSYIFSFFDDGQFLIFGASLFTISLFLMNDNRPSIVKKSDKRINNLLFWALIFCAAFYAIIYTLNLIEYEGEIATYFLRISSIGLYLFAIYALYRSVYLDILRSPSVDISMGNKTDIDEIIKKLEKGLNE